VVLNQILGSFPYKIISFSTSDSNHSLISSHSFFQFTGFSKLNYKKRKMGLYGDENPWFTLDTVVVGLPALVTAGCGTLVVLGLVVRLSMMTDQLPDDGTPERKATNTKIRRLGEAISAGATTFLLKEYTYLSIAVLALFVLVAAAVNWRTGIW
jgi:hypothetical protein